MAAARPGSSSESSSNVEFFSIDEEDESEISMFSDSSVGCESFNITARSLESCLQTLIDVFKPPSIENWILTLAVKAVLDENKTILKEEFLQEILRLVEECFREARTEKNSQNYSIKLEKAFASKRSCSFHHFTIRQYWMKFVFDTANVTCEHREASDKLLQQVLQHFWSSNYGRTRSTNTVTVEEGQFVKGPAVCDESEFDTIRDHAGWVIKRARETIKKGEDAIPAKESDELESSVVHGSKLEALNLISSLGQDVKQADGKYRFIIYEHVVPFFLFLHNLVESLINSTTMITHKGNILIDCLNKLYKNKELREKWIHVISKSDVTSVVLLQRIVTFFVKSKQQIIREKSGLKPNKGSMAIRQQLQCKVQPDKKKNTAIEKEVNGVRSGSLTSDSITDFLHSLSVYPESKQEELLQQLNGKELSTILKSLGKPALTGKKKSKQIATLTQAMKHENVTINDSP